jgi:Uncharacterized conserved protein
MGRAFEYRKATKMKRWGHMARTFTKLGKQIAIAVKAGGPEPENNPTLRALIANCKRENMKQVGNVQVPQKAFLAVLKLD